MKILLAQNMIYLPTLNGAIKGNHALVEGLAARDVACRVVALATIASGPGAREAFRRELAYRGIRVNAATGVDIFELNGVEVHAVTDSAQLRGYLIQQMREFEPTWTVVSSEDPGQILLEAALKTSPARVIYYPHTTQALPFGPKSFLPSQSKTELIRQTAGIIVLSQYIKKYIREWGGCESVLVSVPMYGAGPFARLGRFDQGYITIINPCRVKGIAIFVQLARQLPAVAFAAVPTWGTTDAERARLETLPNVRLLKPVADMDDIFHQTRVLLVPSLGDETFGLVVVEAMLRGIPVLASDLGGLSEAKLGVDYLLPVRAIANYEDPQASAEVLDRAVPEQDLTPWLAALGRLLADRSHYEQLAAASREAALAFVAQIDIAPLLDFLAQLAPKVPEPRAAVARPKEPRSDLANLLDTLSPKQRAFLAMRLRNKEEVAPKQPPITRRATDGPGPLSFAQQRLWFLDRLDPGTTVNSLPAAARFSGALHVLAVQRSFGEIVRRHEILRTVFPEIDGQPAQVVLPARPPTIRVLDLSGLPNPARESLVRRLAIGEAQRPFDLARGPLLRITLLRLGDTEHVFLMNRHHIIFDAWSIGIEMRELATFYRGFVTGKPAALPEPALHYIDYAIWQRTWLTNNEHKQSPLETQLAYWKRQLADAPLVLELPTDRPRPARQTFRGAHQSFMVPLALTAALQELSRREGATLFMTLLAAFTIVLHHASGQEDIVVGSPIADRTRPELQDVIGNFINTLVLRTNLSGNPTFRELLGRVRDAALGAYANQDLPFEKLVEELDPARSLSHSPLFQVVFGFQNVMKASSAEPADFSLTPLALGNEAAKVDLTLTLEETERGLGGVMQYNTDLFDEATITRLAAHYQQLLAAIVATPGAALAALPLLTQAEARQLHAWSTPPARVAPQPVHSLIAAHARLRPDAVALVADADQRSYAALVGRANQLAQVLRAAGVGPELPVALALPPTADRIVALLAVLAAGGAVVPLDLSLPSARLATILDAVGAPLLLTDATLLDALPSTLLPPLCLDELADELAAQPISAPPWAWHPEQLAYLIFTSGSTGAPKGVAVPQRGLANLIAAQAAAFALTPTSRVLQFAPLSVDAAIAEVLVTLGSGATLVLPAAETRIAGPALRAELARQQVTTVTLPPTVLGLLPVAALPQLTTLVAAGEACGAELVARWGDARRFVNAYGPTEATVCATLGTCAPGAGVTIGRPLAGSAVYVLDGQQRLAGIGVVGELYLGGVGLARGYLGRPDLTAERFVPNPFVTTNDAGRRTQDTAAPASCVRLYATGDLARWRTDGRLEYVGRVDQQVKLRGLRVELGEVEAVLRSHPAVAAGVVLARTVADELRLVAYVVPADEVDRAASSVIRSSSVVPDVRAFLKARLPEYMLPSAFVLLDALPLLPNGKLDRQALPEPALDRPAHSEAVVAPRTPTEEVLAGIWADVLRLDVSIDDNFFDLGGHSLLAAQAITRIQDVFGVELPLRSLFELPSLAAVAEQIDTTRRDRVGAATPPLQPAPRDAPLPLSFAQQGLWFLDQLQPGSAVYNTPNPIRLRGPLDIAALTFSLNQVLARHEALRTHFALVDGQPVQRIAPPCARALPLLDLRGLDGQRELFAQQLASAEVRQPFDLARGPLLRATLLRLSNDDHVVLLTTHHIVSDGWSLGVLVREVTGGYAAARSGRPMHLPALTIQYADYAVWQRAWLRGAALAAQLAYWKRQLADLPTLDLPTDYPRPPRQTTNGATYSFALAQPLYTELKALSRRESVTLFMLMLTAFQALLARYSGQDDIVVGAPISGRSRIELEPLIGFFLNTLVLRVDLAGDPSFRELMRRVREVCLSAYAHQDVPFEQVVEALQPDRDLSRHPLFQVRFALQAAVNAAAPSGPADIQLQPFTLERTTTKFDLLLLLMEGQDGLTGALEYSTDLFAADTITRLADHFQVLLAACVAQPATALAALPLLTAAEREQMLYDWNATQASYPDQCIHELFAAQAASTPDAVAVVFEEQRLSYAELNVRADQLAAHLRALGVGPDVRVGICLERSLELMIGVLGVLKAGGAYVPIDPALPPDRKAFMLEDSRAAALITTNDDRRTTTDERRSASFMLRPSSFVLRHVVDLAADWPRIACASRANPISAARPDHLAYAIYTSGSTGQPKAVAVAHRQLVNYVSAIMTRLDLPIDASYATISTIAADLGNTAIFPALCYGGCLHIIAQERVLDAAMLAGYFRRTPVDCLKIVPSHLAALLAGSGAHDILPRRCLVLGGEATSWELIERIEALAPACRIVNHYGPTETTVGVMAYALARDGRSARFVSVPLGDPLANTQIYVLDRLCQPVPIGVAGEVYIGGAGLARGYLDRPELTAEKFVPDPFATTNDERRTTNDEPAARPGVLGPSSGVRLYKTGDLARYRADRTMVFLGRADDQVKLRGLRIELGEVAAALRAHPLVKTALVLARDVTPVAGGYSEKQLVAYIVTTNDERRTTNEEERDPSFVPRPASLVPQLRALLAEQLPDYMVPSAFVLLDALPLTANGKLDRRALPAPDTQPAPDDDFVAPRSPVEEVLAQIWAGLLRRERIAANDNFFALGGHSLLAIQSIARAQKVFGLELPVRKIFETPTLAGMAEQIEIARRSAQGLSLPPLQPVPRDAPLPLSFAQQRLWFLDQLEPGSTVYTMPSPIRLRGPLDIAALTFSLNQVLARHEALRTHFALVDGQPVQRIAPPCARALPLLDLRGLDGQREPVAHQLVSAEVRQPFDLARGPLLRATLLRLADDDHVVLLTTHHIVSDGWSLGVLVREVTGGYAAARSGRPVRLPTLAVQYADYAVWQRAWLRDAALAAQLAYWRTQLAGVPTLDLPTDYPRPPLQRFTGTHHSFTLAQPLRAGLLALGQAEGVTFFMLMLAAFQMLLARYSGQDDIVVGAPIAGRGQVELEPLIGFFVNTLALRVDLTGKPTFRELARRVREVCLAAYAHQDVPFEQVVEALQPDRDLSRHPIFQVMFSVRTPTPAPATSSVLTLQPLVVASTTTKFDLSLVMADGPEGLSGTLEYSTALFGAGMIARLAGHFRALLAAALAQPATPLADLPLLTAAERQQLLYDWNATSVAYPAEGCLHDLIAAQATRTPDAIAVAFEEQRLSYAALDARANQLAHYLQQHGVGPDTLVALCCDRSLELVVALLGVLKAGGAYVPLDPTYPAERLRFMLADSAARVLVTDSIDDGRWTIDDLEEAQPAIVNRISKIVHVSADWLSISTCPATPPASAVTQAHLAYVIYTSGSTGVPKGAMNSHQAILNRLRWMQRTYRINGSDQVLQKTPYSFDVSVWEFFWPLLAGARLVLARPGAHGDPAYLARVIAREQITTLHFVPSMLEAFLQSSHQASCTSLRRVICSGEALTVELQQFFFAQLDVPLYNLYGPTEAAVDVTAWECSREAGQRSVPIGRPIANTQIMLLDRRMQPVPIGVPGELFIGGVQLARGYHNRPDLTAERFIPNPFVTTDDERRMTNDERAERLVVPRPSSFVRLYKTGDLARFRPDGAIEYLGRIDQQIKLRGFRIELGEIAAVLRTHGAVAACVVAAHVAATGDTRLVAYVVPTNTEHRTPNAECDRPIAHRPSSIVQELRSFLQTRLPDYMLPAAFVRLDALPLLPNGKVDRRALPDPTAEPVDDEQLGAQTPAQELLVGIWQQVLGRRDVGVQANFFGLGGHSLLATQVVSRVRTVFGVELPLRALFEAPTVAGLAARIALAGQADAGLAAPPLVPVGRGQPLPLSFAQQRLWFLDQLEPSNIAYQMPYPVRLSGALDVGLFGRALNAIIQRHESLRTTFESVDGRPVQVIAATRTLSLPVLDLVALPTPAREALARQLAMAEVRRPFDLARGPLVRATLLRLDATDQIILLNIHHIVSDGWSMGVFVRELALLYAAFANNAPAALAELPIQYADYAVWQRNWFRGTVLETQLAYWRTQLAGLVPLELPTDRPRPAVQTFRGALHAFALAPELSEQLAALSQAESVTIFMTLLAAFQALLARYSNQHDIVVGTFIANRHRPEVEPLIGFFVNNLVLRSDFSGEPSFRAALGRVREVTLGAYAHQDTPFELLLEDLQPQRDLSRTPIFQVMIVMQNTPMPRFSAPGLTLGAVSTGGKRSDFDLTLWLSEGPQGLTGLLEYSVDLFDEATVTRMGAHLQTLLRAAVAQPDRRLAELSLLTDAERQQLFGDWQAPRIPTPDRCVHQLFAEQAARTPDAVALVWETRQLTYGELNRRANQLARHLLALGVRPDARVGICADRSPELVVGLLGILKAGAAYLPLDPTYPPERLGVMLADAQAQVLLVATKDKGRRTKDEETQSESLLDLGLTIEDLRASPAAIQNPKSKIQNPTPDNLAYVIYTSGSTGVPKGVMIAHASLASAYVAWAETYELRADACHLQMANVAFDVFSGDLVRALCSGAKLVLCPRELLLDGAALYALMRRERIDSAEFVPAVLRNVLDHLEQTQQSLRFMRLLAVGSDSWYVSEYARIQRACVPETRLINSYGLSEATIDSSYFAGAVAHLSGAGLVPIGRPFPNVSLHVLDARMQPAPIGVAGELYVGGAGLARGYLGQPALTAERFVPNPFATTNDDDSDRSCVRLYKTGDLARYRADGDIEFLRRADHQVKVRGFRVELGEIAAVLGRHTAVRECVVLAHEIAPGDTRLVAYVVPTNDERRMTNDEERDSSSVHRPSSFVGELRTFLAARLPDYMLPTAVVSLEALPLTPNGKVDRAALPAPSLTRADIDDDFAPPRTQIEEIVAQIWAGVLRLDRVGTRDNFFALGGHSLLVTQVIARVQETFQVELPLRRMFESPTVAELSEQIATARNAAQGLRVPPLLPIPRDGDLALSFAQQRLWFIDQLDPNSPAYNIPSAVRLTGPLDLEALRRSLSAVVRRHEMLRTTFRASAGQPVQVIGPALPLPLPLLDLHALPMSGREAMLRELAVAEGRRPFDLTRGPLMRATLLRLDQREHVLLLTMHHIASDGWSVGVLIRDVVRLYAGAIGAPTTLPDLPIQYADFAHWQRQWLQGDVLDRQLAYWRHQLSGAPAVLELPTDRPRPAVQSFGGASQPLLLAPELSAALRDLSRQERTTLFMTLLAAFQLLLSRYSGQDDIVVGTDIANRTNVALENLIGFFVNQLVLRTNLAGNPTFRELARRVRERVLGAYAHQDLPFERLVEALRPQRSLAYTPLFQVKIVFQNAPMPSGPTGALSLNFLAISNQTTKYDLTLFLTENARGISGTLEYNTDLFDGATAARMVQHFTTLLENIVAQPDMPVSQLAIASEVERRQQAMDQQERKAAKRKKFMSVAPKAVNLAHEQMITTGPLQPGSSLPLLIQPAIDEVDLIDWAREQRNQIESLLRTHGALLFRGFNIDAVAQFEAFALTLCPELFKENGEHNPVSTSSHIQTPVFYAPSKKLLWHNENSFNRQWPLKIWFCCSQPAQRGGETPIVDSRKVFELLDPRIRAPFIDKGVMYVRTYGDGLGLSWQSVFQTEDAALVEQHCRANGLTFEWKAGDRLQTRQVRPAVAHHPQTGELSWFNQAQHWHVSCLDAATRESMLALFRAEDLPRNCYYGDGSPIADATMSAILDVYQQLEISFPWQQGDVMLLDNLLTAHGRNPFEGQRTILVALGEMMSYDDLT